MANAGAVRAGKAFVEVYADNTSLEKGLRQAGHQLKELGTFVTRYVSLPLAGVATAAFASSAAAQSAFKDAAAGIKGAFSRLGDQLSRDLDLKNILEGAVSAVENLVSAFEELPKPLRLVAETAGGIAIALGPVVLVAGHLVQLIGKLAPAWVAFKGVVAASGLGLLGAGGAIIGTAAAGLGAGFALNKAILPQGDRKTEEKRTDQVATALANKAFGEGRSSLLIPTPAPRSVESLLPDIDEIKKSLSEQGVLESEMHAALLDIADQRGIDISGVKGGPTGPTSAGLESFLRESGRAAEKGAPEGVLAAKAAQAKQVFEATLGEITPVFNKFSDETWGTYFERLANGIRDGGKDLKQWIEDTQGKRIFGPMADKFKEDQKIIRDSLGLTEQTVDDKLSSVEQELRAATSTWTAMRDAVKDASAQGIKDFTYLDQQRDKVIALRKEVETLKQAQILQAAQRDITTSRQTSALQGGGVNLQEDQRNKLIGAYNQLSQTPGFDAQSAQAKMLKSDIEALQTPMQAFIGQLQAIPPLWQQIGTLLGDTLNSVTSGVGNMVAQALIYQQNIGKLGLALLKQIGAQIISTIIQIGIQTILASVIIKLAFVAEAASKLAGYAAITYAAVYAANAGLPLIGPEVAAGYAAAAVKVMLAGAAASGLSGKAVGLATTAYAKGGISTHPALAAVSERGRPELHLTRPNIKKHFPELLNGGGGRPINLQVLLGRDVLVEAVIKGSPDFLRLHGVTA